MDGNAAYIQVKQYVEQGEWKQAYEICKAVIADQDNFGASFDQAEEMALIQIQCLLKEIDVMNFNEDIEITAGMDRIDAMLKYKEEYSEVYDLLDEAIVDYFCFNGNEDLEVFVAYARNIYNFLLPIYIDDLKNIMDAPYEHPIDCSLAMASYRMGISCLTSNLMLSFSWAKDRVGVEDEVSFADPNSDDLDKIIRILQARQAAKYSQEALERTNDFPYYMDQDAAHYYLNALNFCRDSFKEEEDNSKVIMRKKLFVNIACNFLNAIIVREGQQFSMLSSKSMRLELVAELYEYVEYIQMNDKQYKCPPFNESIFSTI